MTAKPQGQTLAVQTVPLPRIGRSLHSDRIHKCRQQTHRVDNHRPVTRDLPWPGSASHFGRDVPILQSHLQFHVPQQPHRLDRTRRQSDSARYGQPSPRVFWSTAHRITQLHFDSISTPSVPRPRQPDRVVADDHHRFAIEQEIPTPNLQAIRSSHLDRTVQPTANRQPRVRIVQVHGIGKSNHGRIGQDHHRLGFASPRTCRGGIRDRDMNECKRSKPHDSGLIDRLLSPGKEIRLPPSSLPASCHRPFRQVATCPFSVVPRRTGRKVVRSRSQRLGPTWYSQPR